MLAIRIVTFCTEIKWTPKKEELSGLFKKRIARAGQGKSGGFRTLVATNRGDRWVIVFGFSKNVRANVDKDEQEALRKLPEQLLGLPSESSEQGRDSRRTDQGGM